MGNPYSMDIRERISRYIASGHSRRAASRVFGISASTAVRLAADDRDRGAVTPKPQGCSPGITGKLKPHIAFLVEIARAEPDLTLKELAGALEETHGVLVHLSSIYRALIHAGFSYKKRPDRAGTCAGGYQAGST